jgi:hydroxymethylglutaryl-CoA reductase
VTLQKASQTTPFTPESRRASGLRFRECATPKARRIRLAATGRLAKEAIEHDNGLTPDIAALTENAASCYRMPIGIADHFIVNGRRVPILMATQERTVVAAASKAAKSCGPTGGFKVQVGENLVVCQIAYPPLTAKKTGLLLAKLAKHQNLLREEMRPYDTMLKHGGGIRSIEWKVLGPERMIVIHLTVDTAQAMGANAVTRMGVRLAEIIARLTGVDSLLEIVTNCFQGVEIVASARWRMKDIGGKSVAERIMHARRLAALCGFRAATHNKGIANGIDAVALACGQDVQAIQASLGASASVRAHDVLIAPLTTYRCEAGALRGELRMRIPLGVVGGACGHPDAAQNRAAMGIKTVRDLAEVIGAVGLAQNFAALLWLVTKDKRTRDTTSSSS